MRMVAATPLSMKAGLVAVALLITSGCALAQSSADLSLATWNLEWLLTPSARAELGSRCVNRQPSSNQHALPCATGHPPTPVRNAVDFDALARTAQQLRDRAQADVVALQEVDGPAAAQQVFRQGWKLDCFVQRAHPQKVGFAIRSGTPYRCNGDLSALDVDGSTRAGADMTLYPGTAREVRLLSVHLKSGCFDGRLDRRFLPCERLREQVPVLRRWVEARSREGVAYAVLGDFNRHLEKDARYPAGPDESAPLNLFNALSLDEQGRTRLVRATEGADKIPCDADDRHKGYIDDILVSAPLAERAQRRQFTRLSYAPEDRGRVLSDHCPVVFKLIGALPVRP